MSMADKLISPEPATGATLWSGPISNVDAEVARARAAWPAWAAQPLSYRIETLRRFANVVRGKNEKLADLITRETGKPIWEALTEVDSVINKVEISDRKSVVTGKSVSVRVDIGGCRTITQKKTIVQH